MYSQLSTSIIFLLALVSAAPSPEADTPKNDQNFSPVKNTIRNLACIRSGNTGAVCHDGGKIPDPGAVGGKTSCGTDALELGIVGIDHLRFGQQTGKFSPTNLCGRKIKITRVDSKGKRWTTTGRVMDRIRREQYEGPQIDLAPDLNKNLGGNGKDNIQNSQFRVEFV